jgi:hypothetical protein
MIAALIAAGASNPARAGGSDPKAVLDDLFGQMNSMCGGNGDGPAYDLDALAKKYFVPALVKIITRDYEQPGALGFDILIDGQDCKTSDLKLDIIGGGGQHVDRQGDVQKLWRGAGHRPSHDECRRRLDGDRCRLSPPAVLAQGAIGSSTPEDRECRASRERSLLHAMRFQVARLQHLPASCC